MSRPPSKSGGFGRDGSSRGPARGNTRGNARGSGGRDRDGGTRDEAPRDGASGGRGGRAASRRDGPRIGSREDFRDELPRRSGPRDGAPRRGEGRGEGRGEVRSEGRAEGRSENRNGPRANPREERRDGPARPNPRASGPRDGGPREGQRSGARSGPGDGQRRGQRYNERSGERGGYRDGGPRSAPRAEVRAPRPNLKPGAAPRAAAPTPKDPTLPAREGERIAKLLARAGIASRREVERMITEGRVKLGDEVIDTPATVLTSLRGVTVDGTPVRDAEGTRLFLFHKPAGLLTAERDPAGRPTIYAALRNALPADAGRVMPIGRLDLNTEGLLLLTNDGEFKRQLELPATGVPRTYRARTFGDITQAQLEELMEGIEVDGVIYGRIDANMERRTGRNQWIEMTLTEGKNREVRRVLEALGLQVSRLLRTAYGPFRLGDLPKGMAGEVSQRDLDNFRRTLPGTAGKFPE